MAGAGAGTFLTAALLRDVVIPGAVALGVCNIPVTLLAQPVAYVANDGCSNFFLSHCDSLSVIDLAARAPGATVVLPSEDFEPIGIVIAPDGRTAYVTSDYAQAVLVIDTDTNALQQVIRVGGAPAGLAVTADGGMVLVADWYGDRVVLIDTAARAIIAAVSVPHDPTSITLSPDGCSAYVTQRGSTTVAVVDLATLQVRHTIGVNKSPAAVAFTPDGAFAYVTNSAFNTVSVIDVVARALVATIPVGGEPTGIVIRPDGGFAYVTQAGSNTVSVIDTSHNTVVTAISVGRAPGSIAMTPGGNAAYVANYGSDTLSVIDTRANAVVDTVPVGRRPVAVRITPDGRSAYVTNYSSGSISVIEIASNSVTETIPLDSAPRGVAVTPDGRTAYVTDAAYDRLYVVDTSTNTVINRMIVGESAERVTITPDGAFVYVTNSGSGTVSVVDTSTDAVVATIDVGRSPFGVAISPDGRVAYVTNSGSDSVSVIDTGRRAVVATIPVHRTPMDIAITPDGTSAYVVNQRSETVSVIDTQTATVPLVVSVPQPIAIAVAPDGASVYVGNRARTISVISRATHMVTSTIALRASPTDLALSSDGSFLYVTSFGQPGDVAVVDIGAKRVVATIPVGDQPRNIAIAQLPYAAGPVTEFINPITPNLQLIDASGNVVADPDALGVAAKMSARTPGAAADGVTRLVLRVWSDTPVTFELPSSLADGCFAAVGAPQQCNLILRDVTPQFVASVGRSAAFALYITPPDFSALPTSSVNRSIVIQTANATGCRDYPLNLWRSPIVLMHGLWGDPGIWDEMVARLNNHFDAMPFVHRSNYEHSNAAGLAVNAAQLFFDVRDIVDQLAASGIAAVQVDVVAKSMGGLLARLYAEHPLYLRRSNYRRGDLHKLITLDTPHCGSFWARLVFPEVMAEYGLLGERCFGSLGLLACPVTAGLAVAGLPAHLGAIQDLAPSSPKITGLKGASVPSHAVAGNVLPPTDLADTPCLGNAECELIRATFRLLKLFGVNTVLVDRSDAVVEVGSQIDGLRERATRQFPVFHIGPAPFAVEKNGLVGDHVAELIQAPIESDLFDADFPAGSSCRQPAAAAETALSLGEPERVERGIRIVSPERGARFRPGQTVHVQLESGNGFVPAETLVLTRVGVGQNRGEVRSKGV